MHKSYIPTFTQGFGHFVNIFLITFIFLLLVLPFLSLLFYHFPLGFFPYGIMIFFNTLHFITNFLYTLCFATMMFCLSLCVSYSCWFHILHFYYHVQLGYSLHFIVINLLTLCISLPGGYSNWYFIIMNSFNYESCKHKCILLYFNIIIR